MAMPCDIVNDIICMFYFLCKANVIIEVKKLFLFYLHCKCHSCQWYYAY